MLYSPVLRVFSWSSPLSPSRVHPLELWWAPGRDCRCRMLELWWAPGSDCRCRILAVFRVGRGECGCEKGECAEWGGDRWGGRVCATRPSLERGRLAPDGQWEPDSVTRPASHMVLLLHLLPGKNGLYFLSDWIMVAKPLRTPFYIRRKTLRNLHRD